MKIAILKCDEVLDIFQQQFGQYPGMIENMFATVDGPFEFDCFDCRQGHYPEDLLAYDCYITTGSKASVYDDEPWIRQFIRFVRQLDREKKKLIGICFGHQIIALAYHGRVEKSEMGWRVGVASNRILATPDWMGEKIDVLNILVSHQDQITALPDNALILASNPFCPFFIVQWNDHFLSIQGHPEWNRDYARTLMHHRKAIIPPQRIKSGLASLNTAPDSHLFMRWIINFVRHQAS